MKFPPLMYQATISAYFMLHLTNSGGADNYIDSILVIYMFWKVWYFI